MSYGVVDLFGCLSWPYIDGQVSRSTPSRSTKQRFPYTNLPWALRFLPLCQCRIRTAFDTAIVLGLYGLRLGLFSIFSCWAGPGVPKGGTQKVMPMSVAPKCLVESKTRARTLRSSYASNLLVMCRESVLKSRNLKYSQVNRRDERSMSLVQPTDRDLLTALGQNNIDLHQTRVPGLEFGTG